MSALILPHRLQQQPQQALQIDRSNPLADGLASAVLPGLHRGFDLAARRPNTIAGTRQQATASGISAGFGAAVGTSATDKIVTGVAGAFPGARSYYFRCRRNGSGGGGLGRLFDRTNGSTGQMAYWSTGSNALVSSIYVAGVEQITPIPGSAVSVATGKDFELVLTHLQVGTTATILAYINATLMLTATVSGTPNDATVPLTIGNRNSDNARGWDGLIECAYVWNRILTPADVAMLAQSRYQIFKAPARRLWLATETSEPGLNPITGALASSEAPDTLSASGAAVTNITGAASTTEGADALAASGSVLSPITGTMAATEAPDTLAAGSLRPPADGSSGGGGIVGGGSGSVREVRAFADELDQVRKPTKGEKKRRKQAIEAAVLELLPDEPAAERAAPIITQLVARSLPPATWAPVYGPRAITLPPAVAAEVQAKVQEWLALQMMLADLEDDFETELLLLG